MTTDSGDVTLADGETYTSLNSRVYVPDLRNKDGWTSTLYVRNDGTEVRNVSVKFYKSSDGQQSGTSWCYLPAGTRCVKAPF